MTRATTLPPSRRVVRLTVAAVALVVVTVGAMSLVVEAVAGR